MSSDSDTSPPITQTSKRGKKLATLKNRNEPENRTETKKNEIIEGEESMEEKKDVNTEFQRTYKGPLQELAKLKDEIKQIHGSLKEFDMSKYKKEKKNKEEDFEQNLKQRLDQMSKYAEKKELENRNTQYPDPAMLIQKQKDEKLHEMKLRHAYENDSFEDVDKEIKMNKKLFSYGINNNNRSYNKTESENEPKFILKTEDE